MGGVESAERRLVEGPILPWIFACLAMALCHERFGFGNFFCPAMGN